jgi:1,4-alpha-glucan branching enzyme
MEKKARKKTTSGDGAKKKRQPEVQASAFHIAAPDAKSVALAGDFNNWDPALTPLKRDKAGVWKVALRLQPGRYQYKFLIDGIEWKEDPGNPNRVSTPFGTFNSVCEVS